jgi:hypothetical protein
MRLEQVNQIGNQGDKKAEGINLKVVHRDVRVIAGIRHKPRIHGGFISKHLEFARKIASRHQNLMGHWPQLQRTFQEIWSDRAGTPIHRHWNQSITLAPRLNLTLLGLTMYGGNISDRPQTADRRPQAWQPVRRTATWRPVQQLLQRVGKGDLELIQDIRETIERQRQVISRGWRVENLQTIYRTLPEQMATAPGPANYPTTRPVPRVLRRSPQEGGAKDQDQAFKSSRPSGPTPFRTPASGFGPAPPNSPPIDMNQLTNQVMQAIDRRLLAYRERIGRV